MTKEEWEAFKIKDTKKLIISFDTVLAITTAENIEMKGYDSMSWDELIGLMTLQWMKQKQEYATEYIRAAQRVIKALGYEPEECIVYYKHKQPLVIEVYPANYREQYGGFVIIIAPRIYDQAKKNE